MPVLSKFLLIVNTNTVLLHGLTMGIVALPYLAVAVIEDRVVFGLGKDRERR